VVLLLLLFSTTEREEEQSVLKKLVERGEIITLLLLTEQEVCMGVSGLWWCVQTSLHLICTRDLGHDSPLQTN